MIIENTNFYNGAEATTGTATKTYHTDHLLALATDSGTITDRWEYSSYGTVTHRTGTSDTPFQFHGGLGCMTDSNGLVYMRARYYNPRAMRFVNQDPIGFAGGLNWYSFVGNNPITGVDPTGLYEEYLMNPQNVEYWQRNLPKNHDELSFSASVTGPSAMVLGTGYKSDYLGGGYTGRYGGWQSALGYQSGPVHEARYRSVFQVLGFTIRENNLLEEVIWSRDEARHYTTDNVKWFPWKHESTPVSGFSKGAASTGAIGLSFDKERFGGTFTMFALGVEFGPASLIGISLDANLNFKFNKPSVPQINDRNYIGPNINIGEALRNPSPRK